MPTLRNDASLGVVTARDPYVAPRIIERRSLSELAERATRGRLRMSLTPYTQKPRTGSKAPKINCVDGKYGTWTPFYRVAVEAPGQSVFSMWLCLCDCGHFSFVRGVELVQQEKDGKRGNCRVCRNYTKPYGITYWHLKAHAAKFNREVMSYDEFLPFTQIENCHYCAEPLRWAKHDYRRQGKAINLDRMDNCRGYTKDNVVPCCWTCNATKSDKLTYEEMLAVGKIRQERGVVPFKAPRGMRTSFNGR